MRSTINCVADIDIVRRGTSGLLDNISEILQRDDARTSDRVAAFDQVPSHLIGEAPDGRSAVGDQFAAMPSIHVGWAAVVALGAVAASRSPWRWLAFAHLPLTVLAVTATGHHWWLDGVAAIALLLVGLRIDTVVRSRISARGPSSSYYSESVTLRSKAT